MSKKSKQQNQANARHEVFDQPDRWWKPRHTALAVIVGGLIVFAAGFLVGSSVTEQALAPDATQPDSGQPQTQTQTGQTDAYGRPPGHPHYGHAHP